MVRGFQRRRESAGSVGAVRPPSADPGAEPGPAALYEGALREWDRGNAPAAQALLEKAVLVVDTHPPTTRNGAIRASSLFQLGVLAAKRGALEEAAHRFEQSESTFRWTADEAERGGDPRAAAVLSDHADRAAEQATDCAQRSRRPTAEPSLTPGQALLRQEEQLRGGQWSVWSSGLGRI